jgi:polar amino acid transport system substrate-binding protein
MSRAAKTSNWRGLPAFRRARPVVAAAAALIVGATLAGCGSSQSGGSSNGTSAGGAACGSGQITVGTSADFPPMEFRDPADPTKFTGFEIDMVTDLMKHMGCDFKFQDESFAGLIPAVTAGHLNMVASDIYDTSDREKVVDFVDYMSSGLGVMVPDQNASKFGQGYLSLCGKTVGLLSGSPSETSAVQAGSGKCTSAGKPAIKTQTYQSVPDEVQQMKNGRLDAILEDLITEGYVQSKSPGEWKVVYVDPASRIKVGMIFKKGSALESSVQSALKWLISSGEYAKLGAKYGMPKSALFKSAE